MMKKKETRINVHRVFGVAAVLLLVAAALFVGSAAAATDVNSASQLVEEIQKLNAGNVDITITNDISDLSTEQIKQILKSVGTEFTKSGANKFLKVSFNPDKTITVSGDGKTVSVGNGGSVNLSVKDKEFILNCKSGLSGKLTVGSDTLELKITNDISPSLKIEEEIGTVKFIESSSFAKAIIDGTEIVVKNIKIDGQEVEFGTIKFDTSYEIEIKKIPEGKTFVGSVNLNGVDVKATLNSLYAKAEYLNGKLLANGNAKGTLVYGSATISVSEVKGNYGESTSLIGVAKLEDSNLKLPSHQIPVPSFVTGTVYLNGKSVDNVQGAIMTSGSPSQKITLVGPGTFSKPVTDYGKFKVTSPYYWNNDHTAILKETPPSPSGGGGGGGSSVIPTYDPYATPTPTQTWTPIDPSQTGVQPYQSPKSPMPVFGILAGLGAAALAGVVLRRK